MLGVAAYLYMDNSHILIGLVGRKRAGKDTAAATLVREFDFTALAYADPVKEAAERLDPIVGVRYWPIARGIRLSDVVADRGWEEAKALPEVRRTLQRLGTEVVRTVEPDFWVEQLERRLLDASGPVVVTDCRFPNEVDLIRQYGGLIVRVVRPSAERADGHSSEQVDDLDFDIEIVNDGTLEDLAQQVRRVILTN